MCGINLVLTQHSAKIDELAMALSHRGIRTQTKSYFNCHAHLSHTRLPIQGLDPKYDHPLRIGRYSCAFVGEIFNYKRLDPNAESDLLVLLKQFASIGNVFNLVCDGFWSAIFIDHQEGLIHVITDDLAKKPLYIRKDPLGISSEINPLKMLGKNTPDEIYFGAVAKWGYCIEDRTPYNEIKKIPPLTHLVINPYLKQIVKTINLVPLIPTKRNLRKELTKAVQNRLVSDIPISLLLSGGLDSTIIFELVKQFTKNFTVFHVDNDESGYLNFLDFKGIEVKELSFKDTPPEEALWWNETPVDLGSVRPQYALSNAIAEHKLNVAISGDGADELFGGYGRMKYYDSQWSDIFHELVYYHLPRLDKLMMANTIELRNPYLARRVIECALTLPYKDRKNKNYLKKIFEDLVPEPILNRKKKALKIDELKEDPFQYRLNLIKQFKEGVFDEY